MTLINKEDLIAKYDRVHQGAPGGARKLMAKAEPVEAIPVEWIKKYMRTIKSGAFAYFADPAWTIKMMLEAWQDEQEAEHG